MPYIIFFFKIKNCLKDDLFISCDDRIEKMLHKSAYLQWLCHSGERPMTLGPLVYKVTGVEKLKIQWGWGRGGGGHLFSLKTLLLATLGIWIQLLYLS